MKKENTFYNGIIELERNNMISNVKINKELGPIYSGLFDFKGLTVGFLDSSYMHFRIFTLMAKISIDLDKKRDNFTDLEQKIIRDVGMFPAMSEFNHYYSQDNSKLIFDITFQVPYKNTKDDGMDNILSFLDLLSMIHIMVSSYSEQNLK